MKRFIPFIRDSVQIDRTHHRLRGQLEELGYRLGELPIYRVTCQNTEASYVEEVGKFSTVNEEMVVAIFQSQQGCLICTHDFGVEDGHPMLIPEALISEIEFFDAIT